MLIKTLSRKFSTPYQHKGRYYREYKITGVAIQKTKRRTKDWFINFMEYGLIIEDGPNMIC